MIVRKKISASDNDTCIEVDDVSVMFNLSKNREEGVKEYLVNVIQGKVNYKEFWALKNINLKRRLSCAYRQKRLRKINTSQNYCGYHTSDKGTCYRKRNYSAAH